MSGRCAKPLAFATLVGYWCGELPPEEAQPLEEHLFACAGCTARMAELAALAAGVRGAFRRGGFHAVISPAVLAQMRSEGLRLREYRLAPGGSVNCTIARADDFAIAYLAAPLAGVRRLDLVHEVAGHEAERFDDVPFDAAAGEVLFVPPAAKLKGRPAHVAHVRLIARDGDSERTVGEYVFNHTPS